ncbi:S8 family serine peptidase [Kitasatospora sp. NPDC056800]|uniref:S8 family peptidase n=1 Tax=Kitasatospora sp. NPDC056800 TaxID=3345948 RepID=UPI0036924735
MIPTDRSTSVYPSLRRASAALLLALVPATVPTAAHGAQPPTSAVSVAHSARAVPGQYIVTLKHGRDPGEVLRALGITPRFIYGAALNGFAAALDPLLLNTVRTSPAVEAVEENTAFRLPTPVDGADRPSHTIRAPAATWGLDRIDQRYLPLDGQFTTRGHGAGATAYILDSGIDYTHPEFGGRAVPGFDAIGDGRDGLDCHGHGTHVAGTVAGRTYGVAPRARLVSVRVVDCTGNGDKAQMIAGLDWVASNARYPAVLNASLGEERSRAVNDAATALSDQGVLPVVAAGNDAVDACTVSPASAYGVVTVAATNRRDEEADFSNWGSCVALHAPGQAILSAKLGGGSTTLSGTSMAAPHVTGTAALYLAEHPDAEPIDVSDFLQYTATPDVLTDVREGTPNLLLFTDDL